MADRILMVAFHYPPFSGSSGLQRTLRFSQYLPDFGWLPVVLSAAPRAYEQTSDDMLRLIPRDVVVERAFACDTARHFAVAGRYPSALAVPDRWVSWIAGAVPRGLVMVKRHAPRVIWSTYPIASAHFIGFYLHRITGLPWIADFRDPMVEQNERTGGWVPGNRAIRAARLYIERKAVAHAARLVFCTEGARRICLERYRELDEGRCAVVANGYDEEAMREAGTGRNAPKGRAAQPLVLLHSGVLYPGDDRNPRPLMQAVRALIDRQLIAETDVRIVLRASGYETEYRNYIAELGLAGVIFLEPVVPYREALREMMDADGLLVFQGYTSNPAIPAKLYEYLAARRPVFALVDEAGDTAALLDRIGVGERVPLDDPERIAAGLSKFVSDLKNNRGAILSEAQARRFSRYERTRELAGLLGAFAGTSPRAGGHGEHSRDA